MIDSPLASPLSSSSGQDSGRKRKMRRSVDDKELAEAVAQKNTMLQGFLTRTEERRASMDSYMTSCQTKQELQLKELHQTLLNVKDQNKTELMECHQRYQQEIRELRLQHSEEIRELWLQHSEELKEVRQELKRQQLENTELRQQHREEEKEMRQELKQLLAQNNRLQEQMLQMMLHKDEVGKKWA